MLIKQYIKMYSLEFLRNKSAVFFTIMFPSILLLLFSRSLPSAPEARWFMLASVINYGVQSAMFQTMGMGIAFSRQKKWIDYLTFLPVSNAYTIWGRVLSMLIVAFVSIIFVVLVGMFSLSIQFTFSAVGIMLFVGLLGGIPMGLLASYLGNMINAHTARSAFVIINLLLFFAAFSLPDKGWLAIFKTFIPSYQWLSISYGWAIEHAINYFCLFGFIGYTMTFYFLASYGNKKST